MKLDLARVAGVAGLLLTLTGCPADTLKELVEDKFPDFAGLETALSREYIVGLQPATGFPNLHCCWVGDRTGWRKIAGSWTTEERVEANADVLGVLKAFTIEVKAKAVAYVEAKAEPFYRDQLLNIRHLQQPHCPVHNTACAKDICVDSLKVGEITVTTYSEIGGGVGVGALKGLAQAVEIGGKTYSKDTTTAKDIIVGYKMAPTFCGPAGTAPWFGPDKTPSGNPKAGETYDSHAEKFRKELEKLNSAHSYLPRQPAPNPALETAASGQPTLLLAPPPGAVIAGEVIRVTAADKNYSPNAPLKGMVVAETDSAGTKRTRTIETDSGGGAWIAVGANVSALLITLQGKEVYSSPVQRPGRISGGTPVIDEIKPYGREGPPRLLESGSLTEISGSNLQEVTQISVDGKPAAPYAVGTNYALGRLEGLGPVQVQVACANGLSSPPAPVTLVKITPERVPPQVMKTGQTADLSLRLSGTAAQVPVQITIESGAIRLDPGGAQTTVVSTGGQNNTVRVSVTAVRAGPYELSYHLAAPARQR